jgi:F-type H+-transporting ATPase subunit delta
MDRRVAKRYARALYRAANSSDVVAAVESDLNAIQAVLDHDNRFAGFLATPTIGREEKSAIVEKLFSDRVTSMTLQALRLLLQKRREGEFSLMREEFTAIRRAEGAVLYADIHSAEELTADQKQRILDKLASQSGRKVEAEFSVDPSLIGGVKIALGNDVLDGTVRGSLRRLRDQLKYDLLKQS